MIEISFGKLLLIALIALIVLGPEKLPRVIRTVGTIMRRFRSGWHSVRAEVERELQLEDIRRTASDAAKQAEAVQKQIKHGASQVREPLDKAISDVTLTTASVASSLQADLESSVDKESTESDRCHDA